MGTAASILSTPDSTLTQTFALNILAHFRLVRAFLPHMIATNHGMIVTLASLSAYITPPLMVPYACTKAAALAFHEGLGVELKTLRGSRCEDAVCMSWLGEDKVVGGTCEYGQVV